MNVRIDDRGKYFTPRISKETMTTLIRTNEHTIIGQVHIRPDKRLKDELNNDRDRFLAITDASIYDALGERLLFNSNFLLITYQHIIFISPVDALSEAEHAIWFQRAHKEE